MKKRETTIEGLYIIEPVVRGDGRGWFAETWNKREFEELALFYDFVQDNQSYSREKGTLRGLHLQRKEAAQAKLLRCLQGKLLDVAVDLRKGSKTYLSWHAEELSEDNKKQVLVPRGFAHGFLTLSSDVMITYKVDNFYTPEAEAVIRYNDPTIGVKWGIEEPILLERDKTAPFFDEAEDYF